MPHKHTRREKDLSTYDLPPSQIAKPLPVAAPKQSRQSGKPDAKKPGVGAEDRTGVKRKRDTKKDDAPRAFKRLMAFSEGKKFRSGLDDGTPASAKKQKGGKASKKADEAQPQPKPQPELTIKPGERLSEFAARVDAALPVGGLINKSARGGKDPLGLKVRRTKTERKLHKLYDQWRGEDARIKEKRQEELELAEDEELEKEDAGVSWKLGLDAAGPEAGNNNNNKKKKKKGRKGRMVGEVADGGDPWEEIKKKRGEAKVGLNDVAKAPPDFKKLPRKKLAVGGAMVDVDSVPKAAGSLRRREELQGVRDEVVASYRRLMEQRKTRTQA